MRTRWKVGNAYFVCELCYHFFPEESIKTIEAEAGEKETLV